MKPPSTGDAFPREACGCPKEPWKYPYKCPGHAAQDGRIALPEVRQDGWYGENCCPFCGRVNTYGLACSHVERCDLCGIVSCHSHRMATYLTKTICPKDINPRTKIGRAFLASLNWGPTLEKPRKARKGA